MQQQIELLYQNHCCKPLAIAPTAAAAPSWVDELIKLIYDTKAFPGYDEASKFFYANLWDGVVEGFGKNFDAIGEKWQEDFNTLAALQRNVVQFSNAKDYTMQREMLNALIDGNGKLRSFRDFKQVALPIADRQQRQWLQAEYELTVASAQMSAKWQNIVKQADTLPLLQFDAVLDNHTTKLCKSLDGVILPVDHWFWTQYYPPNHFGCRSTVRQLATGKASNLNTVTLPDIPEQFKTNLAQNGLLYPAGHPYYNGYDGGNDKKLLQKVVKENARAKYEGMQVQVADLGKVGITWQGIKKGISTYADGERAALEVQLNNILPNLLQSGVIDHSKNREDGVAKYYYLSVPGIDGIDITIKETPASGKIYYGFSLKK